MNDASLDNFQTADFDREPFAQGASRYAHKGRVTAPLRMKGTEIVVKTFKQGYAQNKHDWSTDIVIAKKAQELAEQFNTLLNTNRPINFRNPTKVTCTGGEMQGETLIAEPYLYGTFTKWISNAGWISHEQTGSLPAFAHWTWVQTNGQLLVCDLQGVKDNPTGYWLTDPAINSMSKSYGQTDLGEIGINLFFATHHCTDFCRSMGIHYSFPMPSGLRGHEWLVNKQNTSYQGDIQQMHNSLASLLAALR